MLHEKIQSTIGLIEDVMDNRKKESDNTDVARRNSIFFDTLNKLTPSISSYILVKKHFDFTLQANTLITLNFLIEYSTDAFANSKVINPNKFRQNTESFVDAIAREWNDYFRLKNSELINGLNIIVLVHPCPMNVRNCISTLNKCGSWPLTQETISSYIEAKTRADNLLKEMRFDEEIKDFLVKVRDKRATLMDLSPSIIEWIKAENIAEKVCLSIKNQ